MAIQRPAALTNLTKAFARIYPDQASSRMLVVRAGIDEGLIAFDPRATVNWTEIVSYGLRNDALDALIDASGDEDLHPELLTEMKALLAEYRKWAQTHATTVEDVEKIAAQPAPGFFERARTTILSWSSIAIGCFVVAGALARESRHAFLGLPGSHTHDLFTAPAAYAAEGWSFLRDLFTVTFDYIPLNPLGFVCAAALVIAVIVLGRRLPRMRRRFITPTIVIPLLLVGGVAKTLWYDAPVTWYANVLIRDYRPESLIVPRAFTTPARARWKSIVCSRVAGNAYAAALCGSEDRITYRQNIEGMYLLDAGFTILLCTVGVFVIRKLLLPSRDHAWNLSRRRKWRAAVAGGIGVLFALLPVPFTYSRTVRSTAYPYICPPNGECYFRICADDQCQRYTPGIFRFFETGAVPEGSRVRSEDILTKALEKLINDTEIIVAPI